MKNIVWLSIFSSFLIGCSSIGNDKYKDIDIIDTKDPVDERALIEQAMTEQRNLLKPGFITKEEEWEDGFELFFQETSFNEETEELAQTMTYIHTASDTYLPFEVEHNIDNNRYTEIVEQLNDPQPLEEIDGYYGYIEEDQEKYYQYIAKKDNTIYYFENEEDQLDEELVAMMGNSLKLEEDGANNHFYKRFKFSLEDLHFPQINKEQIKNTKVTIGDLGHWGFDNNNFIKFTYELNNDIQLHFYNYGVDLYTPQSSNSEIKTEQTEGDIEVTTFDTDVENRTVYLWEADNHYYVIELDENDETLSTEEVYAIVDSSREDSRKFSNEDIFENKYEEDIDDSLNKEILQRLSAIKN